MLFVPDAERVRTLSLHRFFLGVFVGVAALVFFACAKTPTPVTQDELVVPRGERYVEAERLGFGYVAPEDMSELNQPQRVAVAERAVPSTYSRGSVQTRWPAGVEQWRSFVVECLYMYDIYSEANEALVMRIINGESGGDPGAHRPSSQYWGLGQFGDGWVRQYDSAGNVRSLYVPVEDRGVPGKDWRLNPYTSIRLIVKCVADGSVYQQFSTAR